MVTLTENQFRNSNLLPHNQHAVWFLKIWPGLRGAAQWRRAQMLTEFKMNDRNASVMRMQVWVIQQMRNYISLRTVEHGAHPWTVRALHCHREGCGKCLYQPPTLRRSASCLQIETNCIDGCNYTRNSPPLVWRKMESNISFPAACFASSNEWSPYLLICESTGLEILSKKKQLNIQAYVISEVNEVWTTHSEAVLQYMMSRW